MIETMTIKDAKYLKPMGYSESISIQATINDQLKFIPIAPGNRFYDEIKRQVDAGTITIEAAS